MNKTDLFADNWSSQDELIERLKETTQVLKTPRIESAFRVIDRQDFVREGYEVEAYEDYPIPIGQEQTISQPTTVAYMLEQLAPAQGDTVLDVGCGSGWTTALLAAIVGQHGHVIGMELREDLAAFGQENLGKYDLPQAEIRAGNPLKEKLAEGPFSRILVSAAAKELPTALVEQLAPGGTMVIPIGESVVRVIKQSDGKLKKEEQPGFRFVPLQH